MLKTLSLTLAVSFCIGAAFFSFWAASLIVHVPGWQIVQGGVLFMGMCYAVAAIMILEIAGRRARRANGGR